MLSAYANYVRICQLRKARTLKENSMISPETNMEAERVMTQLAEGMMEARVLSRRLVGVGDLSEGSLALRGYLEKLREFAREWSDEPEAVLQKALRAEEASYVGVVATLDYRRRANENRMAGVFSRAFYFVGLYILSLILLNQAAVVAEASDWGISWVFDRLARSLNFPLTWTW